ncbi:MAG: septal ring lytic transglycosylase RlpA family protein [Candidatus Peribacteraceae bacterium]
MKKTACFLIGSILLFSSSAPAFAATSVTRRQGFLTLWQSLQRPVGTIHEDPYADVPEGAEGEREITYAKDRGLLEDEEAFHPDDPLRLQDALLWLFRTRSVEAEGKDIDETAEEDLPALLERYPITSLSESLVYVEEEELLDLMRDLDGMLRDEIHEVSLYSEKFHGKGTAFGETFDMNAFTAAHRTFPHNTLVKVTNADNGKSVLVRINDRGPYVKGRDMDLSLAAFLQLAPRSAGVLRNVTFQRLGDANLVGPCQNEPRYQSRITRNARLLPGIPHFFKLGSSLTLRGSDAFVLRHIGYPDGNGTDMQEWVLAGETYTFSPSVEGRYSFFLRDKNGKGREMVTNVIKCSE